MAISKLKKELGANLIAVPFTWLVDKGHLGELQDPATFFACNGTAYTPPAAAQPAYPFIPPGASTAEQECLFAENKPAQTK